MANEKRLIDLDLAIAKVKDDGLLGTGYSDSERIDDVCDMLESCLAVDAVEVVHGRWIISGEEYRNQDVTCSACGDKRETYGWPRKQLEREYQKKHYCPNCGAKMDGDGDG